MKNIIKLLLITFLLVNSYTLFSQSDDNKPLKEKTIENQFIYILAESSNYQNYKVIKKNWIYSLKDRVIDSIKKEKNKIIEANKTIEKQDNRYNSLKSELEIVKNNLEEVTNSKDSIDLFGTQFNKSSFKSIIGMIIGVLVLTLLYLVYLFKNANKTTKKAIADYNSLDQEFSNSRSRALEREQVLNRKLQDELNKQKK